MTATNLRVISWDRPPAGVSMAKVYCPICTHTVQALVVEYHRQSVVQTGQKCPHCAAALDAGYVFRLDRAA